MIISVSKFQNFVVKVIGRIFYLHPIWWLIGCDQLIFPLTCTILLLFGYYHGYLKIRDNITLLLMLSAVFQIVPLINLYFEPHFNFYGKLFFYKTWLSFSGLFSCYLLINCIRNKSQIEYLFKAFIFCVFSSMIASIIGYFLYKGGWSNFQSLFGYVSPEFVKSYDIFKPYLVKEIISSSIFFSTEIIRTKGLYQYANLFSFALEQMMFISILLAVIKRKKRYWIFIFLCLVFVFFTTSRAGIVSLILGLGMIFPLYLVINRSIHFIFPSILLIGIIIISITSYYFDTFSSKIEMVSYARGQSFSTRQIIYQETIKLIGEHPFIGWGTPRKISENMAYAGSHSFYLSLLLKNGVIGLSIFLLFISFVLRKVFSIKYLSHPKHKNSLIKAVLAACVIQQLVHMLLLDINDDVFVLNQTFCIWGIIASFRLTLKETKNEFKTVMA
jgi:O-antigen ligase